MADRSRQSVVIVQYAGDYAEAWRRLADGGAENYYAQRYSLDVVAALANAETAVTVVCCTAERDEDVVLPNGVRVVNLHSPAGVDQARVWDAVARCAPTHVCLRTPLAGVLRAALRSPSVASVLVTLADSFEGRGLRERLRAWRLQRLLNHRKVVAVGNHGVTASRSLQRIGVNPAKIVPWDWPHSVTPHQSAPKTAPAGRPWKLFFGGLMVEAKGVDDVVRALRLLRDDGIVVQLDCAGRGDIERLRALAEELGVAAQVRFLGMIAHAQVVPSMRAADLVVIPSRHEYPEGFPMTVYEALSSRTPIVASDHPMYAPHLARTQAAAVFAAADPAALAAAVRRLMSDPAAYAACSRASAAAWDELQLPVTWGDLLVGWMAGSAAGRFRALDHALAPAPH